MAAILDVLRKPLLQRNDVPAFVLRAIDVAGDRRVERLEKLGVITFGHAEDVGDSDRGERRGVVAHELAASLFEERVHLAVGQAEQELLTVLEAPRGQKPRQQVSMVPVLGRIERNDVVAERKSVAVLLDQIGNVIASGLYRKLRGTGRRPCCNTSARRCRS